MVDSTGGEGDDSLYPIAILIDELKHEDMQLRLNSMRRLSTIANALGPVRTRTELIGFLGESVDDEDEVLQVLAEELGKFVEYVGGAEHAFELLGPLESLATVEENTVREQAVKSINNIVEQMPTEQLSSHYMELLRRLARRDWFTSRISSCSLFASGYAKLPDQLKTELREIYTQLCRDDTPMVRRAACTNMTLLAPLIDASQLQAEFLPLFTTLAEDDQDSVRLSIVDCCLALVKALDSETQINQVLPVIFNITSDTSWRVRWSVANKYCDLCAALGKEITNNQMVDGFEKLLQDAEAEVRTAAAAKVTDVAALMNVDHVLNKVIPCVANSLAEDASEHVRSALASNIMGLAPIVERENTINLLLPVFLQLLRDESSEVRLNIIKKLDQVNKVIGIDLLSQSLLPSIVELAEDRQWRVRLAIIELIPSLAEQLGVEFFNDKLCGLCQDWLGDNVWTIRDAATRNLLKLTQIFGCKWSEKAIVPRVLEIVTHSNYLHRMISIIAITLLAEAFPSDFLGNVLLPPLLRLAEDPIPNIRFNICKSLQTLVPRADSTTVNMQIKPILNTLTNDSDRDVKYYAQRAIGVC